MTKSLLANREGFWLCSACYCHQITRTYTHRLRKDWLHEHFPTASDGFRGVIEARKASAWSGAWVFTGYDSGFGILKTTLEIWIIRCFIIIYTTAQLGNINMVFRRCLLSDSILSKFSRILSFQFLFPPSLSQNNFFNLFNSRVRFNKKFLLGC